MYPALLNNYWDKHARLDTLSSPGRRGGGTSKGHSAASTQSQAEQVETSLTLVVPQSTWWTIIPNTCKAPQISTKRRRRHGCEGVARLELTESVRRVARLRNLLEPAAEGRGVAETAGESTRATSSTVNRRAGWPPCGAQVSCTSCPCALRCLSYPLTDLSHACHRPRVQEMVSEASWHLFY